jgi:hypothetical protein
MAPTLPTRQDAGGLERHWNTGPRGLKDVQAGDSAADAEVAAAGVRAANWRFTAYGKDELYSVLRFKYMVCVLPHNDNGILAMRRNLKQARATWG